jgi:hypothetical protein
MLTSRKVAACYRNSFAFFYCWYSQYKSIHVKTSQSAFTSRCLVSALNNWYFSALFSTDVSWQQILTQWRFFSFRGHTVARWLTLHTWTHSAIFSASLAEPNSRRSAHLELRNSTDGSDSESELLYDWRLATNLFHLATSRSRLTTSIFFQLNTCGHSPYVISSVTWGWVCRLYLLLGFASAVILRSESPHLYPSVTGWSPILNWTLLYNHFARIEEKSSFPTIPLLLYACLLIRCLATAQISFPRERVYRAVTKQRMYLLAIVA